MVIQARPYRIGVDVGGMNTDAYRPKISKNPNTNHPEWLISEVDLAYIADGCYVLGCGGGGQPYSEFLRLREEIRAGHTVRVVDTSSLADDAIIYWGGYIGSPAVSVERLAGPENLDAVEELMEYLQHSNFDAFMSIEIGGACGLLGMLVGSSKHFNTPAVDADWMGRAYPMIWQITLNVYESNQLVPCVITSDAGTHIVMTRAANDLIVDRAMRAASSEMGSRAGLAMKPTTKSKILDYGVRNTLSLAWRIGRCIARAESTTSINTVAEQIIEEAGGPEAAKVLFRGKIVSVERSLFKAHSYGEIIIQQISGNEEEPLRSQRSEVIALGGQLKIPFKNENIYAQHIGDDGAETYIAMVPDLISVLDTQSGRALGVPEYKYGLLVTVLGITCSPRWTDTERGIELGGPRAFGYDIDYKPLGSYSEPKSVIFEYQ